jgi:succinoglycan biosynthesis protein ExoV
MKLIYFDDSHNNVGDALNPWMWPKLLEHDFDASREVGFLGIGSILSEKYIRQASGGVIFGSGVRHRSKVPNFDRSRWTIRFVRGPLSSEALGGADVPHITDPALLAPLVYKAGRFAKGFSNGTDIGYVRYFKSPKSHAGMVCSRLGLREVDPGLTPDDFLNELSHCRLVITEAMHGAILADSFRIPWIGVRVYSDVVEGRVAQFKWEDWLRSMQLSLSAAPRSRLLSYMPMIVRSRILRPVSIDMTIRKVERALGQSDGTLSNETVLKDRQTALLEQVDHLKRALS